MVPEERDSSDRDRARLAWVAFALALAAVLVYSLRGYLGWIVFGIFLYYVSRPVARRLRRRGLSEGIAAMLTIGFVIVPFVIGLGVVAFVAVVELAALEATDVDWVLETLFPDGVSDVLPTTEGELYPFVEEFVTDPTVGTVLEWSRRVVSAFVAAAFNTFLTMLFVFFLLRDEQRLAAWFRSEIVGDATTVEKYARSIDAGLSSIFFGYALTILAITVLAGFVYTLLNVIAPPGLEIPSVLLLTIITGLISAIPLVGRTIVYVAIVAYLAGMALRTDPILLWFPVLFYLVMGGLFDTIIRTYVRPTLSGRMFPTGLVLFAYILGPAVFGWYGVFLGPILMVVTVTFVQGNLPSLLHEDAG